MNNDNALSRNEANDLEKIGQLKIPEIDLKMLPAKMSKRLWISPGEFVKITSALILAEWALNITQKWQKQLPTPPRRGPKPIYQVIGLVTNRINSV